MSSANQTASARGAAIDSALEAVSLLALAVWLGGLVTLGAVAAPLVFGIVPAPASADAMTAVFRRFDSISIGCAVVVLLVEGAHGATRRPLFRRDLVRGGLVVAATALAIVLAMVVSPHIERLHRAGAVRGLGAAGLELDSVHHTAEGLAKTELALLVAVLALHAFRPRAASAASVG
jgi:putative copper export protein